MTAKAEGSLEERVTQAHERAVALALTATRLEAKARRARRQAQSAQHHYEQLLRKHRGEQALPFTFDQE